MLTTLKRTVGKLFTRSLDAAGAGKRWAGQPRVVNLNADMLSGATVAAQRAAWFARNNPNVAAGVQAIVANAIGTGIKPRSRHPDAAVRDQLHRLWDQWERVSDASGRRGGFYHQQALAVRAMVEGGESFARLRTRLPEDGLPVPLQVELISRDQVPTAQWSDLRPGNPVRAGIEFNMLGQRVAFWVLPVNPADPTAAILGTLWQPVRIPAEDMIHMFRELVEGQLRGLTWLAPVLLRLRELDQYEDAALVRAKVAAMLMGFICNKDSDNPAWKPTGTNEVPALEPGVLAPLNGGESVEFTNPPDDKNYTEFTKGHLRAIAAGLGCTYFQLSGDLKEANYSSLRGGLVEFRRQIEQLQHLVIVPQFCDPVWRRFVTLAVLSGAIDAPDFYQNPEAYLAADWHPPGFDWVDPVKDVRAEIEAINAGLKSREQSVAETGADVEEVDRQIAADHAREKKLGLAFVVPARDVPPQVSESTAATPPEEPPMVDLITRAATLAPTTADPATRTVRATISTGAAVASRDAAGPFLEVLDLNGINPSDLVGVPVLDRHRQDSVDRVLGVVTAAGRDAAGLWADLQVSARAEGVWQDVLSGVLRGVSVGYGVMAWQEGKTPAGIRTKTATAWKIQEVSLVPIPADAAATVRSHGGNTMPDTIPAPPPPLPAAPPATDTGARAAVPTTDHDASPLANRAAVNQQIRSLCRSAGMDGAAIDALVDAGATVDAARNAAFDAMLTRSAGRPLATIQVLADHDAPDLVIDRMGSAFAHRATQHLPQAHRVALPDAARSYAGRSLLSLAAELADRRGSPIGRYADPSELYQRALSTSDFPNLLANTANKTLLPAYQAAAPSYRRFFSRRDFRDFKPASFLRVGDFPVPLAVGENGEYKHGAISESGESITLGEYGRVVMFSRKALINDDLGAFADLPTKAALRVADWENSVAWALVVSNPTMADGYSLFDATHHGNQSGSGGAISVTTVGAGEAAMMGQTSLDGLKLNLHPAVLATSPTKYVIARQFCTTINPTTADAVNPFGGVLAPIADANLSGNGWYLFAEPSALETFVFGYLQGQSGPVITPEPGFDVAGVKVKLTIDFAVGAVDHRGAYYNAGA